ncbi:aldehyde dehydrogenase family protein [Niveispirillum fermenti]|uniref:aldehyde dehydrogenase family protein n=1 Tax=Niveispirillum fermenti TaxID=1233113 RepID=UPI003A87F627
MKVQETPTPESGAARTILIDGEFRPSRSQATFPSINPATAATIGDVSAGDGDDVDDAVRAARQAFEDRRWLKLPAPQRARILHAIADRIEAELEQLARNEVLENGMPLPIARATIGNGAQAFRYFAGWIGKIHGQTGEMAQGEPFFGYTLKEPMGVAALIVPWNGPFMMACHKVAPALAAGCTAILKPAEDTSLNSLRLAAIALEAGVPPGVLNVVTGLGSIAGAALAGHDDVDKVSFTGSTAVGRQIVQAASGNFKRLSLELGGKSPVIVLEDADLEKAVPAVLAGIMTNSGQACVAGSRLYAHRGIYDRLIQAVSDAASKMVVGNGLDPGTQMGPVISRKQRDRIQGYIDGGIADGAELVTGGRCLDSDGFFVEPTILSHAPADSKVMREEIFGPVLSAMPFDDLDWVIRQANATRYGLAGAVYTRSLEAAHTIARSVRSGNFWINCYSVQDFWLPFGGYKESGWGRERGAAGLDAFMETKSVVARLY